MPALNAFIHSCVASLTVGEDILMVNGWAEAGKTASVVASTIAPTAGRKNGFMTSILSSLLREDAWLCFERGLPRDTIELEQAESIEAADLEPVGFADAGGVEPIRRVIDVLQRPIGREQDTIGPDLKDRID